MEARVEAGWSSHPSFLTLLEASLHSKQQLVINTDTIVWGGSTALLTCQQPLKKNILPPLLLQIYVVHLSILRCNIPFPSFTVMNKAFLCNVFSVCWAATQISSKRSDNTVLSESLCHFFFYCVTIRPHKSAQQAHPDVLSKVWCLFNGALIALNLMSLTGVQTEKCAWNLSPIPARKKNRKEKHKTSMDKLVLLDSQPCRAVIQLVYHLRRL